MSSRERNATAITVVLAFSGSVVSIMQTLLVPLLPDIPSLIKVTADDASWLITATLLASSVATPSLTRLADMYGKRRMMLIGLFIMITGSALGAVGKTLILLIVARIMQGFAMALIPIGISIMRDELPKEKLPSAVALVSGTLGIGAAVGLPLSGVVYSNFGWHAVFWFSAGIGVCAVIGILFFVPESQIRTGGKFDFVGAILLSISLVSLLLGITKGSVWGWNSQRTLTSFAIFVVVFALWVPFEIRRKESLVDLATFRHKTVLYTNLASLLIGFSMYANMLTTTQLLQIPRLSGYGFGIAVTAAGLALLPAGLSMVAFAPVSARITSKFGPRRTLLVGSLVLSLGYVGRIYFLHKEWQIIAGAIFVSAGTAIAYAAMPTLIMRSVPITETSAANGVNTVLRTIGTSVASATIATLLSTNMLHIHGVDLPRLFSFQQVYVLAAMAALLAAGTTFLIPREEPPETSYGE